MVEEDTVERYDAEVKMDKEVDPGNYILYNNDDDNGDDTKDYSDTGATNGEDDLQKVHFAFGSIFNNLETGKVVIERSDNKLKLWKQDSRTSEIAFTAGEKIYDLSNSTDRTNFANDIKNKDLYVEGADKSSGMRDTEFTLRYVDSDDADICVDPVKYTIFKIDLDVNADGDTDDAVDKIAGYIPGYEAATPKITYSTVTYTSGQSMKIITEPVDGTAVTEVVYTITSCSDEPGFCMNSDATPSTSDNDYSFKTASEDTEEAGTISGGKASVDFYCKDFGGYCDVQIALKKGTDTVFEITRAVPSDTKNGNNCADPWPGDVGPGGGSGATDDTDNNPVEGRKNGDGLTRYQEYRGFIVDGSHTRTDPADKDLFIYDEDNITLGYFGALGLSTHLITNNEWSGTGSGAGDRVINIRQESHTLTPQLSQHGLHLRDFTLSGYQDWGIATGANEGPPRESPEIRVDVSQIRADMAADKPTAAGDDRDGETVDYIIAHELGHGVYITHHAPTGGGTDNCIMRYIFNEINTHKRSVNNDAPAWMAMTIPNTFCNTAPDTCRDDAQVTDAP